MKLKKYLTYSLVASSVALTVVASSTSSDFGLANEVHAAPATSRNQSAWASPYINAMRSGGLLPTSLSNTDLTKNITREEFAELVTTYVNKAGMKNPPLPKGVKFSDSNNPLVAKAAELGIVEGIGNNKFAPKNLTNREEIATMTTRAEKSVAMIPTTSYIGKFKDQSQVSSWAREGVGTMVEQGAIDGMGNNTFAPKDKATREQAIKIVAELANKKGLVKIDRTVVAPKPPTPSASTQVGKLKVSGFRYGTATLSGKVARTSHGFTIPAENNKFGYDAVASKEPNPNNGNLLHRIFTSTQAGKGNDKYNVQFAVAEATLKSNMPAASVDEILDYAASCTDRYDELVKKTFIVGKYKVIVDSPINKGMVYIKVYLK